MPAPVPLPTATPLPAVLRVGVATSAARLIDLTGDTYADETDRAVPAFVTGNEAALYADLDAGTLDAVLVHTIPAARHDWFNPIAVDGLVLLVHPTNPARDLTLNQVQDIFSGRTLTWGGVGGVGGADLPIQLFSREENAGTRNLFRDRIMAEQRVAITAIIAPDDAAMQEAVAAAPGGIGYSMMGQAMGNEAVRPLTINGIPPTPSTTADQTYPLTVPLYFVSPAEPQGELRAFLAWLQSDAGQAFLSENYGRIR